jgi:hypothetical protein
VTLNILKFIWPGSFLLAFLALIPVLFMSFTGGNRAEADQLGEAMRSELEWISRASPYKVETSLDTVQAPPALNRLSPADRAVNPKYLINGIITLDGADSQVEITLWDLEGPALLFSQALGYRTVDDALSMVPFFMWSLFAILPTDFPKNEAELADAASAADAAEAGDDPDAKLTGDGPVEEAAGDEPPAPVNDEQELWRGRWLYLGLRGGVSPRFYDFQEASREFALAYEAAFHAEWQFLLFPFKRFFMSLGLQAEAALTMDTLALEAGDGTAADLTAFSLLAPLLLKFNFKPGPFVLSPFGGMYYAHYLPLTLPAPFPDSVTPQFRDDEGFLGRLGYTAGFKFGVKAGKRGTFFLDLRYNGDLGVTEAARNSGGDPVVSFRRMMPTASLGWELGLFNRKPSNPGPSGE